MTPHDVLALRTFGRTRADAHADSTCVRCRLVVAQDTLSRIDQQEYRITALCPACFEELTPEPSEYDAIYPHDRHVVGVSTETGRAWCDTCNVEIPT